MTTVEIVNLCIAGAALLLAFFDFVFGHRRARADRKQAKADSILAEGKAAEDLTIAKEAKVAHEKHADVANKSFELSLRATLLDQIKKCAETERRIHADLEASAKKYSRPETFAENFNGLPTSPARQEAEQKFRDLAVEWEIIISRLTAVSYGLEIGSLPLSEAQARYDAIRADIDSRRFGLLNAA